MYIKLYSNFGFMDIWAGARQTKQNDLCPAKTQISLGITLSDQNLRCPHEDSWGP